ncbi:MAG: GntR family transcriptional regulator [Coxiellaceae bacterium]|nr:GntR family transcriptional regulator [Coxiellaceae bacterium]
MQWNNKQPIYQQLKDKIAVAIMDGSLQEGEAIPSIRQISADYAVNPITVSKAYQGLVDDEVIEKRRGLGMYVKRGAQKALLKLEKQRFLQQEWPQIKQRIGQLGFDIAELLK